jgi:hypothetical protein
LKIFRKQIRLKREREKNKKYNRYFLADAGYDSKLIREKLERLGFKSIISKNKRNNKKKVIKIVKRERNIYKKRLRVENIIKTIKDNRKMINRYECKIENFMGFLHLALLKILC